MGTISVEAFGYEYEVDMKLFDRANEYYSLANLTQLQAIACVAVNTDFTSITSRAALIIIICWNCGNMLPPIPRKQTANVTVRRYGAAA